MTFYIVSILHISWHFINKYSVQLKGDLWRPKRYLSPSLAQSLDHISDYFVPWVATESSLNDGCVSKRSNNNKKSGVSMKTVNNFDCWVSTVSPRWMRRVHPCLEETRGDFFFFWSLGYFSQNLLKTVIFLSRTKKPSKICREKGKDILHIGHQEKWINWTKVQGLCHLRYVRQYV